MSQSSSSPWVARFASLVEPGAPVLDLAAGSGRHTRLFLERGHPVTAVDRDPAQLRHLAGHAALEVVGADLEGSSRAQPDSPIEENGAPWPLPGRTFGAVVVVNYLWRPLWPRLLAAVAPDGVLIYASFMVGNERFGHPANPDFLLRPGELLDVVRGTLEVVAFEQGAVMVPRPAVRQRLCAVRRGVPVALPA